MSITSWHSSKTALTIAREIRGYIREIAQDARKKLGGAELELALRAAESALIGLLEAVVNGTPIPPDFQVDDDAREDLHKMLGEVEREFKTDRTEIVKWIKDEVTQAFTDEVKKPRQ